MKRVLSLILCVITVCSVLCCVLLNANAKDYLYYKHGQCGPNLSYDIWAEGYSADLHASIYGSGKMDDYYGNPSSPFSIQGLFDVSISNSVTHIGRRAFEHCSDLVGVKLPNNLVSIGESAFAYCSNIRKFIIPDSVKKIEERVLYYCENLQFIEVKSDNRYYDSRNDCNAIIETATDTLIASSSNTVIPNTVKCIATGAFNDVTSIKIPRSVTHICKDAFDYGIEDIYYAGSPNEWKKVKIEDIAVTDARIHFGRANSATPSTPAKPATIAKPAATAITKIASKELGFSVAWKKQTKNVTGYQIQYATNAKFVNGKAKAVKGSGNTALSVSGLKAKQKYYVRVRTFRNVGGKNYFSAWSKAKTVTTKAVTKPQGTAVKKIVAGQNAFTVACYKRTKNVTGYQFQYATNAKFTGAKTRALRKNVLTVAGLLGGQRYYVRVRTYRSFGGKNYFSAWSKNVSTLTLKPVIPKVPNITNVDLDFAWDGLVSIYFSHDNNRTGCQLQVSRNSDFSNTELWTSPRNNTDTPYNSISKSNPWRWWLTNGVYGIEADCVEIQNSSHYGSGKYYYRLRAFNRVDGKYYFSAWSKTVSAELDTF